MSRAKWAVLARLDRFEGLKQTELADMLDLQPISLTRLLDSLCANGLIERRADPDDRRAKRLFLTPAARPLLDRLGDLAEELMGTALAGLDQRDSKALLAQLATIKDNLRAAVARRQQVQVVDERYG
jgi:MarR family transcriptional regulator for hemolysin